MCVQSNWRLNAGGQLFLCALCLAQIAPAAGSPYLYGIHDHDPDPSEYLNRIKAGTGGGGGWVTATVAVGASTNDSGGADFSSLANAGHTIICRINYGYFPDGTIPVPAKYDDFAVRCKNFVANSSGCNIWLIANETNLAAEWPFDASSNRFNYLSPQSYADCFRKVYNAIKSVRPNDKVIVQALAPWAGPYGAGTQNGFPHDGMPLNWVQYCNQMLTAIANSGPLDGIALHLGSRGYTYADIHSTNKVNAGGQELYFSFYVYKDWVDYGIPVSLYHLPVYVTECNGLYYWKGGHPENPAAHYEPGWMQEVYAEVDRYNQLAAVSGKPIFRCLNMYRWCAICDGWNIDGASNPYKAQILSDLDAAVVQQYAWPTNTVPTNPPPAPTGMTATVGNGRVTLSWNATPGAASYKVRRSTMNGGPYSIIASNVTTTSYVNTSFTVGATYYYVVSAANVAGESPNSNQASATPTNGLPDVIVTAVNWTPPMILGNTNVVFRATVKNIGSATTPAGTVLGVGFSVNTGGNFTWSGSHTAALAPGASVTLTANGGANGTPDWPSVPGAHTVTANVDDVNRFAEGDESNNTLTAPLTVFHRTLAINSGGSATPPFVADTGYSGSYGVYSNGTAVVTTSVSNPAPQAVYQTERWGPMTYSINQLWPGAWHTVRLHFAEIFFGAAGQRQFNAAINGALVLNNYDILADAGGKFRATVKEFAVRADASGSIAVDFTPGAADNPKLSGLEILFAQAPTNTPPVLVPISNRTVNAGATLTVTNVAGDSDIPPQTLSFSLDPGAPAGATINSTNGVFAWTAPPTTTPVTNSVTVRVTDNGSPQLSDATTFTVTVVPPPEFSAVTCTNSSILLNWQTYPGKTYRVQYKNNLDDPSWMTLGPDIVATGFSESLNDTAATNAQRFYRVVQVD